MLLRGRLSAKLRFERVQLFEQTGMFLPNSVFERAQFIPVFASQAARIEEMTAHIVGISCNYDIIAQTVRAPQVCVGDIVPAPHNIASRSCASSSKQHIRWDDVWQRTRMA
jgi:hypothetical protein